MTCTRFWRLLGVVWTGPTIFFTLLVFTLCFGSAQRTYSQSIQPDYQAYFTRAEQELASEDYAKARDDAKTGLALAQAAHNQHWTAEFLIASGGVAGASGDLDHAFADLRQALTLWSLPDDIISEALNFRILGAVTFSQGKYDPALEYFSQAALLYSELNQEYTKQHLEKQATDALRNAGLCYYLMGYVSTNLGRLMAAVDYYQAALTKLQLPDDLQSVTGATIGKGFALTELHRYSEAAAALQQVFTGAQIVSVLTHNEQYDALASSSLGLGALAWMRGNYPETVQQCRYALAEAQKGNLNRLEELAYMGLSLSESKMGQPQMAVADGEKMEALLVHDPDQTYTAICKATLAIAYEAAGELGKADAANQKAISILEDTSHQMGDPSQLSAPQELLLNPYGRFSELLYREGRNADALLMSERARGQGLSRQIKLSQVDFSSILSPEDASTYRATLEKVNAAHRQDRASTDTVSMSLGHTNTAAVKQQVVEAERQYSLLRARLFAHYPKFRQIQGLQPPTAADLTELAHRHPDTLYLEWVTVDEKTTLLFALSHNGGLKAYALPVGGDALDKQVNEWTRKLAQRSTAGEPALAKSLYHQLLAPLDAPGSLNAASVKRIVVVPDGVLWTIPIAALIDGQGRRLIERFPISVAVSLGELTWGGTPRRPSATLLCAVDPTGGNEPVHLSTAPPAKPSPPLAQVASVRSGLGPLKHARTEAKRIVDMIPGAVELPGPQARERVLKDQMGRYALLHFATHGILDTTDGMRSGLVLAQEPVNSSEEGILRARDIAALPLSASLVTLSACQTGQGQESGGEGLLGLAWAFRAAGCPSVVASLWEVDDAATGRLMEAFYRNLYVKRMAKDEALRQAMLATRTSKAEDGDPQTAPFFWAAFQVIGDTTPLPNPLVPPSTH